MTSGRLKPIKDIRFFERAAEDVWGNPMPHYVGQLYPLVNPVEVTALGDRYALRLAERGFHTRGYHHVYVTLSPFLAHGEVRVGARQYETWCLLVDVGLPLEEWPRESVEEQMRCLARTATRALEHLCAVHELDGAVLRETVAEVLEQGANLELTRLVKETATYTVRVTYRIPTHREPSPVFLEYRENRTGRSGKIELMRLKSFNDVFPLIGSVSVSGGVITLKPRASFRAGLTTRDYKTPVRIPIDRVLEAQS